MVAYSRTVELTDAFSDFIRQQNFPCAGAKSALAGGSLEILAARDIRSSWDDVRIHERLCAFSRALALGATRGFRSFAVLFSETATLSEAAFERALWTRLQSFADKDVWLSYPHDGRVSSDPSSRDFAFSIGGEGYFVVGMHPGASRKSRQTPMPAMIFNPFAQFESLRQAGRYERMSSVIRTRDRALCGSDNPMLAHHGEASAAAQFSGRVTPPDWRCPLANARMEP